MHILKKIVTTILTWEARLLLSRMQPKIIAVTGSVGKTSAKDAIFAVVSSHYHARKSEKSFNSELGVPLTILGLDTAWSNPLGWALNIVRGLIRALSVSKYPEWLVLEVGADHPGDISHTARWLKPTIAVITALPEIPVHVAYFSSPEEVAAEKMSLVTHLQKEGTVIYNGDDALLIQHMKNIHARTYTYGFNDSNTIHSSNEVLQYENSIPFGISFRVDWKGSSIPVAPKGVAGRPRVYACLAALSVADALSIDLVSASNALSALSPTLGRMHLIPGINESTIIDDTYNSSPVAALSALDTLASITAKRRIAVLGDMRELGQYSIEAHRQVGKRAAEVVDLLITVGIESRVLAEAAKAHGLSDSQVISYGYDESKRAGKELKELIAKGDVVLVKGSQNRIRLEKTVTEIMKNPETASQLLVRQEREWKIR